MNEHKLNTSENGPTFILSNGRDTTAIDYIIYQEQYEQKHCLS